MNKIITIDGASGSGKTSLATELSSILHYDLLLSGILYRLLALQATSASFLNFCEKFDIRDLKMSSVNGVPKVYYRGKDCYNELMQPDIASAASVIASKADVREALLRVQREFDQGNGLVAEGRDMGSEVFPKAYLKVFLVANKQERAKRRVKQLQLAGKTISIDKALSLMSERDDRDESRSCSPLVCPDEALVIDTSNLSKKEVMQLLLNKLRVV